MKKELNWWWPDHEAHLQGWFKATKNQIKMNGRLAYQGRKQQAVLDQCLKRGIRRRAIDVGGHVGLWSWNLAHEFDQVDAFEPVKDHQDCFDKNVLAFMTNVDLHTVALGKEPGWVSMWTEEGSSGNTQVKGAGPIAMVTLDSFDFKDVDLIKIDCEGFEENVILGAMKTIEFCAPVIIVEQKRDMATRFDLRPLGAVERLYGLGYKVAEEISGDYIMVR